MGEDWLNRRSTATGNATFKMEYGKLSFPPRHISPSAVAPTATEL